MPAVIEQGRKWTYDEYLLLDDDARYEILEGELIMVPAPELGHQRTVGALYVLLREYILTRKMGEVFLAPIDVVLDTYNTVQPDLVFVSSANAGILSSKCIAGAPDMVVEILSPSTFRMDRHRKKELYERFGVREYWLVDSANRSIEIFALQNGVYELVSLAAEQGCVASGVVEGFQLEITEILGAPGSGA